MDTEAEVEGLLNDVTTIFTNNHGAKTDDNLTDDPLATLSDVTIASVTDNEVLAWDAATGDWINQTPAEAGIVTATAVDTEAGLETFLTHASHVFTNNKADLNLDDLAQALNIAEQEAEGEVRQSNWAELRKEGLPYEGGKWFYTRLYGQIHNGTEHFEYPPTLLGLDTIVSLLKMSLDTGLFDPRRADDCRKGICLSRGCDLYQFGLQRCRKIRYEQKQKQEKQGR